MSNTKIWDALGKTDPAHTKGFKRAGGFSGTAMKPIWIVKRMTEQFGPVGEGWGMHEPNFQVVPADKEVLVFCTVAVWHTSPQKVFYGVGGDKVVASRGNGSFNSDEAFKMAYTDAVNNALKYLGVGADIHMGLFDDSKYVAQVDREFAEAEKKATQPEGVPEAEFSKLKSLAQASGTTSQELCKKYGVNNLRLLNQAQYTDAISFMNDRLAAKAKGETDTQAGDIGAELNDDITY